MMSILDDIRVPTKAKYSKSGWHEKVIHIITMLIFICVTWLSWKSFVVEEEDSSYFKDHTEIYVLVYIVKVTCYLARLPFSFEVFLGFCFYNPFATEIKTQNDYNKTTTNYTLLFRVVTRGLFPDLVRSTLKRNMEMVENVGIKHYMFEVVTNSKIDLNPSKKLREVVVPVNYVTPKGSLYKARSLQYCLEPKINKLKDHDWIIHLDEETLLTKNIIHGIIQFTRQNKFHFGQAVTKFADEDIINWVTTFGDIHRVGADYGHLRNCLQCFNITFDNWRGNFLVSKLAAEREITFDFGPNGSITEDCTFGMVAASKGYTFGFVNGEVWEKSPFTVYDFIKQRQRWIKGVILSLTITEIPFKHKIGMILMTIGWATRILLIPDLVFTLIYPIKLPMFLLVPMSFSKAVAMFSVLLGAIKSFNVDRFGHTKVFILWVLALLMTPVSSFLETCGIIAGLSSLSCNNFYIVDKDQSKYLNKNKLS